MGPVMGAVMGGVMGPVIFLFHNMLWKTVAHFLHDRLSCTFSLSSAQSEILRKGCDTTSVIFF